LLDLPSERIATLQRRGYGHFLRSRRRAPRLNRLLLRGRLPNEKRH
jgi:hypothetical protein